MDTKTYDLVMKLLDSDLPQKDKAEIVRFYTLPRNTPVMPRIEYEEPDPEVGPVQRPTARDLERKANPIQAESEDAVRDTLRGRL